MSARKVARPSILRSVPLDRSAVIEASAGTGKTFTISHLVVELVLAKDVSLDRILIVTFTERARNELRVRVRGEMEALLGGAQNVATEEQVCAGDFWTFDAKARARLANAMVGFDAATITTIHGFCQGVLRENAFASGRLFEEEQVDGREAFSAAFRRVLPTLARDPEKGPWIEAALRSGRSTGRLEDLLWGAVQARGEIRPRFDALAFRDAFDAAVRAEMDPDALGRVLKAGGTHSGTIKAIKDRLSAFAENASRVASDDLIEGVLAVERSRLASLDDSKAKFPARSEAAEAYVRSATRLASTASSLSGVLVHLLLPSVQAALGRSKREIGRYDFDDMLTLVDDALRGPDAAVLARALRARWRYVLIDEFQDTDTVQWSIFRQGFLAPVPGAPRSVVHVVGDPKQSIYRFRGADIDTYFRARQEIVDSGGSRVTLADNYRATPDLVEVVNAIFAADASEPVLSGEVLYEPVGCGRASRRLVDGDGHPVTPLHAVHCPQGDWQSAFGAVIAREALRITDPLRPWRLDGRALTLSDLFVLTRTAREGRVVGEALRATGVPYTYYKEDGLFQTDEASDIRILLSAIAHPSDPERRLAAWLTPFFGLPLIDLEGVRDLPPDHPLVDRLETWHILADKREFDTLFESVLRDSRLVRRQIFFGRGERALTNTQHIFEILLESARTGHKTLDTLIEELAILKGVATLKGASTEIDGNVQRLESDRPAVQIMTIHKSKGLEAPVVFLAGSMSTNATNEVHAVHEGGERLAWVGTLPPAVQRLVKREETEEDERLMYVALTRAMGRLVLPLFPEKADSKGTRSAWRRVNTRILDLVADESSRVTVEPLPVVVSGVRSRAGTDAWSPDIALLSETGSDGSRSELLRTRAGASATSYTRMKAERGSSHVDDGKASDVDRDTGAKLPPGGARAMGIALHELLERVPLGSFLEPDFDAWRARSDVGAIVVETLAAYGVDSAERQAAERLVWGAYTTPVEIPGGGRIARLAAATRLAREMDFTFPACPASGEADASAKGLPRSVRYVRGSLDLVFEDRGAIYFVDWKSDSLGSYAPAALGRHVLERYDDQVKLYSLAMARLLHIESDADMGRFGGALYCFLRGMGERGEGVWFARPTWADLVHWNEDIARGGPFRGWAA